MPSVTPKTCLRCDWQGGTKEAACPDCGVPLYAVGASPLETGVPAAGRPDEEPSREAASTPDAAPSTAWLPEPDPSPFTTGRIGTTRSARSGRALVLAGLVMSLGLGVWLGAHMGSATPETSTDDVALGVTASDASFNQVVTPSSSSTPTPGGPTPVAIGRQRMVVDGVQFSLEVKADGWGRFGNISINKDIEGSQGAEGIIFWTSFPDGDHADPCDNLLHPLGGPIGPSTADLADAVATAPGTELVEGPSDVTLGGRAAKHVVLTVREDLRCDPGFFFTWEDVEAGALWPWTPVGVTIDVWIVDVDGTRLFIEGETTRQAGPELEQEIQQVVGSIRFAAPREDYLLDLATGLMTPLPDGILGAGDGATRYAASPDGSTLAYVAPGEDGTSQIFVAGLDGTGTRQVTSDPAGATWPTWSPDGTMIAYEGGAGDLFDLFVLDLATGETTQIGGAVSLGSGLQFTPDGSSLVHTAGTFQRPELRTVPIAGGESTLRFGLGSGGMVDAAGGSMSPDGSLVTMMGSAGEGGAFRFVARVDGTGLRQIVGRGSNPAGTWSPDGSRIVCSDGSGGIIVIDIATGEETNVADGSGAIWLDDHTLLVDV